MPLPTAITCAGSWPDPEPCTIDTLSSRGASVRMIRLYSGTYLSLPGLASSMPKSISGTNCCGSLTNFFIAVPLLVDWFPAPLGLDRSGGFQLGPPPCRADGLEHHGDADRAGVHGVAAAIAGVRRPPALGEHALRRLGALARRDGRAFQRGRGALAERRLERVDRRDERVEQRLVAEVGVATLLDAVDRGAQGRDHIVGARIRHRELRAGAQERGAPDGPRGPSDPLREDQGGLLQQAARVLVLEVVEVAQHDLEAARERVAEVPVADDRVEVAEVLLVVDRGLGDRPDDQLRPGHRRVAHTASFCGRGSPRHASRSASVTWSPGRAALRLASTRAGSPGSPRLETTRTASLMSSSAV